MLFEAIDLAKISGANAVKLQTFTPEKMSLKIKSDLFKIKEGNWKNYYLYELYQKAQSLRQDAESKISGLGSAASILNILKEGAELLNDARDFNTLSISSIKN